MATDKTINITAKIANLQAIKDQLKQLDVKLKIDSPDLKSLQQLASKGLTIDIRFKVGPELKQLLDLQRKGLNLRYTGSGAPPSGVGKSSGGNFFSSGQTFYGSNGSFMNRDQFNAQQVSRARSASFQNNLRASLNRIDQGNRELAREEQKLQEEREKVEQQRLAQVRRQLAAVQKVQSRQSKANTFVRENPLSALLGQDVVGQAAEKFNLRRSSISARPNFFDPSRVRDPGIFKDILFTTLLGGKVQGAGAAIGAATLGKEGTLIGANVAVTAVDVFSSLAASLKKATEAGAEYERAVTGITGIFQATSEVVSPSGRSIGIGEQLAFQGRRAEGIQRASQRALLPLGISGATSSALTQSLAAGLAQRGLAPDEQSTEILLRRFGGAIQTLQPELASDPNLIRRGFEDIIGGSPQATRTELGSAIRGLAPGLFSGNIRSVDDIVKATESLEQLVVAIKNSDKATVEYRRALGSLELAQQELGKGILEGIAPGLKALADELQQQSSSDALKELGKSIGDAGTALTTLLLPALKAVTPILSTLSGFVGAGANAAQGNAQGAQSNLNSTLVGGVSTEQTNATALGLFNVIRRRQGLPPLTGAEGEKLTTQQSVQSILQTAKNRFGIESPEQIAQDAIGQSPENKLRGLQTLRSTLRKRLKSGEFASEIGLNTQELQLREQVRQDRQPLYDSGNFGQQRRLLDERGSLRDDLKIAEDTVSKRKALLKIELAKSDKTEESVAQARQGVQQAEEEALKIRNKSADKETELAGKRLAIFNDQINSFNQNTFKGRDQALEASKNFNLNERLKNEDLIRADQAIINSKTASPIEINAAKDRLSQRLITRQSFDTADQIDASTGRKNALGRIASDINSFNDRQKGQDAAQKAQLELKELEISTKGLTLEQNRLTRATADANKALSDFTKDARLRELGRQGEEIAAAEAIVAAGGTVPAGISENLVRGTASFDPEARALFEQEAARERFNQVSRGNTFDRLNTEGAFGTRAGELKDAVTGLALDQEKLNLKPEEIALQKRALARSQSEQALENADNARKALDEDPDNPEKQKAFSQAFQKAQAARKALTEGEGAPNSPTNTIQKIKSKASTFSINGETVVPPTTPEGINISSGLAPDLIASNDIGGAILSGISGSAYGKAKESTAGAKAIGESILNGLDKDGAGRLKEEREKGDRGDSVFDGATASRPPLTQQETTQAFLDALNSAFV